VQIIAGQAKAHQHDRHAEDTVEQSHDRQAGSITLVQRAAAMSAGAVRSTLSGSSAGRISTATVIVGGLRRRMC
jgi:hypothetical protein